MIPTELEAGLKVIEACLFICENRASQRQQKQCPQNTAI